MHISGCHVFKFLILIAYDRRQTDQKLTKTSIMIKFFLTYSYFEAITCNFSNVQAFPIYFLRILVIIRITNITYEDVIIHNKKTL